MTMNETELLKLAEKELLGEAKRAAVRYSQIGPSGWRPCPLRKANKIFLANTLLQTISSNRIRERTEKNHKPRKLRERKLLQDKQSSRGVNPSNFIYRKPSEKKIGNNSQSTKTDSPKIKTELKKDKNSTKIKPTNCKASSSNKDETGF